MLFGHPIFAYLSSLDRRAGDQTLTGELRGVSIVAFLERLPHRDQIRKRITELSQTDVRSSARRFGEHWFFTHRPRGKDQWTVRSAATPTAAGKVVLDPNEAADDGSTGLGSYAPSFDGRYLVYWLTQRGCEWGEWRVMGVGFTVSLCVPPALIEISCTSPYKATPMLGNRTGRVERNRSLSLAVAWRIVESATT